MFARWNFTVWSATQRISATWRFDRPSRDELQDLELAAGQLAQQLVVRRRNRPLLRPCQEERRLEGLPDRRGDRLRVRRLQHVRGRAAVEGGVDDTAIVGARQDDHRQLGTPLTSTRDHPKRGVAPFREVDLHHEQVGLVLLQERLGCLRRRRRTDQVDVEAGQQRVRAV